jgi:hypothetical protein
MPKIEERELNDRIECELRHHRGTLPPVTNAAWRGYLAACIEWGLIGPNTHARLLGILPPLDPDPALDILLGRENVEEQ